MISARSLNRSIHLLRNSRIYTWNNKFTTRVKMSSVNNYQEEEEEDLSNPKIARLRRFIDPKAPAPGWERCWEEGVIPWDIGNATPKVISLLQSGTLPKGRAFVPGCGTGYDVVAMACPDRYVLGLDVSTTAINRAKEWSSSLPNTKYFEFLAADFFTWQPTELFDMVFDYTFFCALLPSMRSAWAKKMSEILKPDGELITLIFMLDDQVSGPPYNNCVADYEKVLKPEGFTMISIEDNELAIKFRMGREKLARWKRC